MDAAADETISSVLEISPCSKNKRKQGPSLTTTPSSKALRTIWMTSHQVNQECTNQMILKKPHAEYFKQATIRYSEEKKKKAHECSLCCWAYNQEYGCNLSAHSILWYIKQNRVGEAPMERGPKPVGWHPTTFKVVAEAFDSYQRLNQINQQQHKNNYGLHYKIIDQVLAPLKIPSTQVVQQLIIHSETDFQCKVATPMEEIHTRWTTYKTLSTWFDSWEQQLASWNLVILMKMGHSLHQSIS